MLFALHGSGDDKGNSTVRQSALSQTVHETYKYAVLLWTVPKVLSVSKAILNNILQPCVSKLERSATVIKVP